MTKLARTEQTGTKYLASLDLLPRFGKFGVFCRARAIFTAYVVNNSVQQGVGYKCFKG